jgi:DMSO reductase anchor subunit
MFSASGGLLATIWLIVAVEQMASVEIQILAAVLLVAAWVTKFFWWRMLETNGSISTLETATGLGSLGKVRSLMPPHTSENYLQKEMGFVIARRHAIKLRVISVLMGGLIPLLLLLLASTSSIALGLAVMLHLFGVFVERWLFFAEAKHVVNLYYGN